MHAFVKPLAHSHKSDCPDLSPLHKSVGGNIYAKFSLSIKTPFYLLDQKVNTALLFKKLDFMKKKSTNKDGFSVV